MRDRTTKELRQALHNLGDLNQVLVGLSESDLKKAITLEKRGENRKLVLIRLHQRYCRIRCDRERKVLLRGAG